MMTQRVEAEEAKIKEYSIVDSKFLNNNESSLQVWIDQITIKLLQNLCKTEKLQAATITS